MVIKVYTSGISGNKEVKKRQQRIMMILESKGITYEAIDITEPGNEDDKQFMQDHGKAKPGAKHPLPPQIFNELDYCGDYEGFDVANENDDLETFLKFPRPPAPVVNGTTTAPEPTPTPPAIPAPAEPEPEHSTEKDSNSQVPERGDEAVLPLSTENAAIDVAEVRGYCYTPSLAQRLAKAMERTLAEKNVPEVEYQPSNVNSEDNSGTKETESSEENGLNEESLKTQENNEEESAEEDEEEE